MTKIIIRYEIPYGIKGGQDMMLRGKDCTITFGPENFLKPPILEEPKMDFQVGDKVVDIILDKEGFVTRIGNKNYHPYCVLVKFSDNKKCRYTKQGRLFIEDFFPRLYHKGTTFEINPAKPKRKKYINLYKNMFGEYNVTKIIESDKDLENSKANIKAAGCKFVKTIKVQ